MALTFDVFGKPIFIENTYVAPPGHKYEGQLCKKTRNGEYVPYGETREEVEVLLGKKKVGNFTIVARIED
jgi:hypothetical protein